LIFFLERFRALEEECDVEHSISSKFIMYSDGIFLPLGQPITVLSRFIVFGDELRLLACFGTPAATGSAGVVATDFPGVEVDPGEADIRFY
jgi:hypothetical protein